MLWLEALVAAQLPREIVMSEKSGRNTGLRVDKFVPGKLQRPCDQRGLDRRRAGFVSADVNEAFTHGFSMFSDWPLSGGWDARTSMLHRLSYVLGHEARSVAKIERSILTQEIDEEENSTANRPAKKPPSHS